MLPAITNWDALSRQALSQGLTESWIIQPGVRVPLVTTGAG